MKFIKEDFLLHNDVAKKLFHNYAKDLPIIDYHCHLNPQEIYEDKKFSSLFDAWLTGDHYKWRLLRANGVNETFITGNVSEKEKFMKWAETVPLLIGNPLYHWTHMELDRFFNIEELLSPKTADEIYDKAGAILNKVTARDMIKNSNVEVICTTDDPIDSLAYHERLLQDKSFDTKVLPTFRPDKAVNVELETFIPWLQKLEKVVGYKIKSLHNLKKALEARISFFDSLGSKVSDHALDVVVYENATEEEAEDIFQKGLRKKSLTNEEIAKYKGNLLVFLGREYHKRGWVQQYHIGAMRNLSDKMYRELGADTGFDAINDGLVAIPLSKLLNALDTTDELPKTIIYTLNPRDFEVAITIMQSFQRDIPGKIQFGSAWWFLDTIDGMQRQIRALAGNGLLARFVGMLTDSRSFLSYPRHEYFRRILCNYLGEQVELGYYPEDYDILGKIVSDISYNNAKNYFGF